MARDHLLFVTGRLAEHALRRLLDEIAPRVDFDYTVATLNITVAALMTTDWVARKIDVPDHVTRIVVPGYCNGDLATLEAATGRPVQRGPKDFRDLPEFFGQADPRRAQYGAYDIEILAEINHAPRLTLQQILDAADLLQRDGADVIDLGCDPGDAWSGIGETVRALRDAGHRVSVDSMNITEIAAATAAGAELVLSVDATNRHAAADWGAEVVAIPDRPGTLDGLIETIDELASRGVPLRVDPIIEPIGTGFAASLERYVSVRRDLPEAELMMGIGNLTELTDADSAGINVLLLGFCQELGIRSVLTTQVINWARSSVRECDLARRLAYYAVHGKTLPKHVEPDLIVLRDEKLHAFGDEELARLGAQLRDNNYRLFAENDRLHLLSADIYLQGEDPFVLFEQLQAQQPKRLDVSHAFYLGYEMAKAVTALTLHKNYRQDEALDWGYLTRPETSHRARREATGHDEERA